MSAAARKRRAAKKKAWQESTDGLWERAWIASGDAPDVVASVDRPYVSVSQLTHECLEAAGSSLVPQKKTTHDQAARPRAAHHRAHPTKLPPRANPYATAATAAPALPKHANNRHAHRAPDVVRHQLNVGAIYGGLEDRLHQNDDALKHILAKSKASLQRR